MTANSALPGIDDRVLSSKYLIALDIDGTLVNHDGAMSDGVRDSARAVVAAGHEVILATGRSLGAVLPILTLLGLERGYAVCSNGGVTLRLDPVFPGGYEIVDRVTFSPAGALTTLQAKVPGARFAVEDAHGRFFSTASFQDGSFGIVAREVDFHELLELEAVRVVVNSADATTAAFAEAIADAGLHGVTYAVGWSAWLDIAAFGVTKATALEKLRHNLGVATADTVAIGDGSNDLDMLRWAGRGVAMGQAEAEVQAVANEVTGSVYDDGAATILRGLLS